MSSILTNNGAMVALQTLQSVNKNLGDVQGQISTGLKVGAAKDNAAVFAISQVMKSDVSGFKAISDSLSLGSSTLAVASSAASSIGETLEEIKTKIVSAQEDNVDRTKLDDEINSLVDQIKGVVGAAQFNGLNLIDGSVAGNQVDILSSLNRDSSGNVTKGEISVDLSGTNLSTDTGAAVGAVFDSAQVGANGAASGFSAAIDESGGTTDSLAVAFDSAVAPTAGNKYSISVGDTQFEYEAQTGDDNNAVAFALRDQIQSSGLEVTATVAAQAAPGTNDVVMTITNDDATAGLTISGDVTSAGTGELAELDNINVTTAAGAATALDSIETMIGAVIDAQATFGTAEKRVEMQGEFLSKLTDSFTSGIGSLVDANLEQASARLQALQVQQQLGTQALSIANQAPQSLLSLFR
jgi:flagellin